MKPWTERIVRTICPSGSAVREVDLVAARGVGAPEMRRAGPKMMRRRDGLIFAVSD